MAYNEDVAARVRTLVSDRDGYSERKMFGGLCFMLNGNMFAGVVRDDLMLRLGKDATPAALTRPGAKPMDFTGRPMVGMVFVEPTGFGPDEVLRDWIEGALSFVQSMPPKTANSSRPRRPRSRSD